MVKPIVFKLLTVLILVAIFVVLASLTLPYLKTALHDQLLQTIIFTLTDEEREALYRQVADTTLGMWDVVPDPLVARLAKRDIVVTYAQAEVRTNNAGLRSSKPYGKKAADTFRIVCLGDSFVFGQAGLEEDRFCDQIEAFYRDRGITVGGKAIETYAVGLGGWTAVQEATYLSTRISAYEPDIVLVLTVGNDITDNVGVTGGGSMTGMFSPEHRDLGSATFSDREGRPFRWGKNSALSTDVSPEARARWLKAIRALRRLSEVQTRQGGKILNSVSSRASTKSNYFVEVYKLFYREHGPKTPFVVTSYFQDEQTELPHNPHPSRYGHSIFAHHYIHMLDRLGWLSVPADQLPPLDPRLSLETNPTPNFDKLQYFRRRFIHGHLNPSLDFTRLFRRATVGLLGGIWPEEVGVRSLKAPPWASVRSGFLLRRDNPGTAASAVVEIRIPPRSELFPFRVEMFLDGRLAETFAYAEPSATGRYVLAAELAPRKDTGEASQLDEDAVEIVLRTDSYFSEIDDHRMKSFQLLSAEIREH